MKSQSKRVWLLQSACRNLLKLCETERWKKKSRFQKRWWNDTSNLKCLWSKYRRKGTSDVSIKALVVVMLEKLRLCGSRAILAGWDERWGRAKTSNRKWGMRNVSKCGWNWEAGRHRPKAESAGTSVILGRTPDAGCGLIGTGACGAVAGDAGNSYRYRGLWIRSYYLFLHYYAASTYKLE